jgi:hypothetical protein
VRQITRVSIDQQKFDAYTKIRPLKASLSFIEKYDDALSVYLVPICLILFFSFFSSSKFREDLVIHQQQSQGQILMILVLHQDGRAPHFLVWTQFMKK